MDPFAYKARACNTFAIWSLHGALQLYETTRDWIVARLRAAPRCVIQDTNFYVDPVNGMISVMLQFRDNIPAQFATIGTPEDFAEFIERGTLALDKEGFELPDLSRNGDNPAN